MVSVSLRAQCQVMVRGFVAGEPGYCGKLKCRGFFLLFQLCFSA